MNSERDLPGWKDDVLLTPGPLTTSRAVKQAMLRDVGSRDAQFIEVVRDVRQRLLRLAGVQDTGHYEAVLMQGSGTFGIEAVLTTAVPRGGKVLIVINGAYGKRMAQMCALMDIAHTSLAFPEDQWPDYQEVERALDADPAITHLAIVHCETTTGIVNPLEPVADLIRNRPVVSIVDAMSSFGALPIDVPGLGIDYLVSSANKCIEGVPGFSFVIAKRTTLLGAEGQARSLSLDLVAQWRGLEQDGQFRFTPPTHALLAFHQALNELDMEGGVDGRHARYRRNQEVLVAGMRDLGFDAFLPAALQGPIITSFRYPAHPNFSFDDFYSQLKQRGFVIYPGKVSNADCFRIGSIGRLFESDMRCLLASMRDVLVSMGIELDSAISES